MNTLALFRSPRFWSALTITTMTCGGLLAATTMVGCKDQDDVRTYDSPKDPAAGTAAQAAATQPAVAPDPAVRKPAAPGTPSWAVPAGWTELPGDSSMRHATLLVSQEHPKVQLTVIPLSPPQPLVENVQRWEGQVGLPPSPADKVKDIVKTVDLGDAEAHVVDLTGPGTTPGGGKERMLAAIIDRGQRVWFFKLMGPDEIVGPQKEKFDAFIRSIRFDGKQSRSGDAAPTGRLAKLLATPLLAAAEYALTEYVAPRVGQAGPYMLAFPTLAEDGERITKFDTPKGWEQDKTQRVMRVLTFFVKEADKQAEVSVLKLGKDNIGPLLANVNRWRAQVGAPPVAEVNEKDIPKVTIAGKEAYFFEFTGPNEKEPTKRMFLTMGVRGDEVYFFKITGDAALVAAQKDAFNQFLKSVEFGK